MNLSLNPTAEDSVNLVHATHLIQDYAKVTSFLKNSGFEILESIEVSDGSNTRCCQISLNGSYISLERKNNPDTQEFVDSALTGFGLGTIDIESTQGRLTLHGFHPLSIEERKLLFPVAKKSQREIECKVFKLKKSDVLEGAVEFIDVSTLTKSSAKSIHNNALSHLHAIILCTNKPEETIARYCWLTNRSSPRRIFGSSWQLGLGQQKIIVCSKEDVERIVPNVNITNLPSILGYALLTESISKTKDCFSYNELLLQPLNQGSFLLKLPDFISGNLIIGTSFAAFPWNDLN
tara:strand:- start:1600 stop:2475 length:876 start_codon:yes stop_codon:yes gene_type:complete